MDEREIAEYKMKRSILKAQMTRINNFISASVPGTPMEDFTIRLEALERIYLEIRDIDEKLTAANIPSDIEEFENRYYAIKSRLKREARDRDTGYHEIQQQLNDTLLRFADHQRSMVDNIHDQTLNMRDKVRLPKLNIAPFGGKFSEFPAFKDLYMTSIHENNSLSNVAKFQYLRGLLTGDALALVRNFNVTDDNYSVAWELLLSRYDKKKNVVNDLLRTYMEMPSTSQANPKGIREIHNIIDEVVRALKMLGNKAESRDPWLIYIALHNLDRETRQQWAKETAKKDFPTIDDLLNFLDERCDALESTSHFNSHKLTERKAKVYSAHVPESTRQMPNCLKCKDSHHLHQCESYLSLALEDRRKFATDNHVCYNCLYSNHTVSNCPSKRRCYVCNRKHHSSLHTPTATTNIANTDEIQDQTSNAEESATTLATSINTFSLLPTALVRIKDKEGNIHKLRMLLDSGSQVSLITQSCVNRLNLQRQNSRIIISGIASTTVSKGTSTINISPHFQSNEHLIVKTLVVEKIMSLTPKFICHKYDLEQAKGLQLADPTLERSSQIDILLGSSYFFEILRDGRKNLGSLTAINSTFGWILSSSIEQSQSSAISLCMELDIDKTLRNFWELEEEKITSKSLTDEEKQCNQHFVSNFTRLSNGRYKVCLPFKDKEIKLGNTFNSAHSRFISLERQMSNNPKLKLDYCQFMNEYEKLGHMEEINPRNLNNSPQHCYLPHHAVFKQLEDTTKIRVVFDASSKSSNGRSLNSVLLTGPTIQPDLVTTLLRFRRHPIVLTADIEKMYRQVIVHEEDCHFQRILWRNETSQPIKHYQLNTVTYGTSCAPFLAIRTLHQLAEDEKHKYPKAAQIVKDDFYVDDVLTGCNTIEEAIKLKEDLTNLLALGGFNLTKWCSNAKPLGEKHLTNSLSMELHLDEPNHVKILSLHWVHQQDYFTFKVSISSNQNPTKRNILSNISKIFDPMGWVSPVVISVKILLQRLWLNKCDWDDVIPTEISHQWQATIEELKLLESIQLSRILPIKTSQDVEIHGFSDSSELAYAAVIYLRSTSKDGVIHSQIITSKTKVAPLKQISLPRLELCAAHLLSKVIRRIIDIFQLPQTRVIAWTDSTIVLNWLADQPRRWKTFIANRTSAILENIPTAHWRHVPSKENPADCASRGTKPSELIKNQLWWNGPNWLQNDESKWPANTTIASNENFHLEERTIKISSQPTIFVTKIDNNEVLEDLFENHSQISQIIRTISLCLRFIRNLKCKSNRTTGPLTVSQLQESMLICIKWVQGQHFLEEIKDLSKNMSLSKTNKLISLSPFLDNFGIMRVGGRLQNSQCNYNQKHPIILPKDHGLSTMILISLHKTHLHPGPSLLQALLRQKYWIVQSRSLIRNVIQQCTTCIRYRKKVSEQLMGSLSHQRVTPNRPFSITGVDYAGPITTISKRGRGAKQIKSYIAVFVCMSVKAVHLETVSSLSTDSFLAALRRFISRRGLPKEIFSDNGTNFVGARRKLNEMEVLVHSKYHNDQVADFLVKQHIQWSFIPPISPHFGGLWESTVKQVKTHLIKAVGITSLTFEELQIMLCQIEAILNSRPLWPLSQDATDNEPLTPGHFLILAPLTSISDEDLSNVNHNRLDHWRKIQQQIQYFWKRYSTEYLHHLQQRQKWNTSNSNFQVGDIVIIKESNTPPCNWPIGKIISTHPGNDGLTRVVSIKTSSSAIIKRPIHKLNKLVTARLDEIN